MRHREKHQATALDALRERLNLTGTKKGRDLEQCGACTILLPGHEATLHYEVRGQGPFLLLIPGGAGDAASFEGIADDLAVRRVTSPSSVNSCRRPFVPRSESHSPWPTPPKLVKGNDTILRLNQSVTV